ncbi:DUF4279 domain-containing protein [Streptosporangium roseum]|uniref:DUF4279 domain-containing protein n=1 Tax=Streptosporangium roseum (strain ATCC 12428 / DSM 43021 / JCM 3005 / KCTC 9067 / NCIMB 10171 / NRRL 2505 / NI 9100) TaxID=479432 RepID=D2B7U1_STRRD|nr:DUF4279 domain-containing protein [Streptosporangium roseum]ACZ83872.1 hypothetical protein Sros_0858 [Streptosporangium roseum DSM 43021]
MRVRQYVYFALKSETMTAAEIATRIGLEPDETMVRGSRTAEPPRPVVHAWKVACHGPGMTLDEMIAHLVDRVEPFSEAIGRLARELDQGRGDDGSCAVLQVVRYLDDEDGEEEDLRPPHQGFEKIAGQHQLLGWHLDRRVLQFLVATRAELDVDEYG